ncbi:RNA polymerase sigma factor [Luteolibacter luteus]|uniref:Sigma-70 family RNA polymerase sigma factor n=1 Tax=Luteolibacter luteus TaxID=2728835 RepID=A0A858RQI8_9BACT|nr:sigma-70 family RNA polymerase sigma factor [Luteolibacter luteus]QJE98183.1 sigma-70 family RNA polymerase sigma factor [Luteolibacter luteus]
MTADDIGQLLEKFTRERSEAAFRELVRVHSPVVYGTALRMLGGDRAAAQDVTQEVFTLLARKAGSLGEVILSAWLYRQASRRASNLVRAEGRRKQRELVAAEMMNPSSLPEEDSSRVLSGVVDRALLDLPSADRDALVLRYFEGQDYRKLGSTLGTTEEAARKRVSRAIEKLAAVLRKRGIAVGSASLGTTMASLGSTPVPATVLSQVTAQALLAVPAAGWAGTGALWQPFVAGLILSAVAVAGTLVMQDWQSPAAAVSELSAESTDKDPTVRHLLDDSPSSADLIAEIKRTNAGPKHALTRLRMGAVLERIPIVEIGDFILLAHDKLTPAEQAACFEPLLGRWLSSDPAAAMDFVAKHDVFDGANKVNHTSLTLNLFVDWRRKDHAAAQEWLLRSWDSIALKNGQFGSRALQDRLALEIADSALMGRDVGGAIAFLRRVPDAEVQGDILKSLMGGSYSANGWQNLEGEQLLQLQREIGRWPGGESGRALIRKLWTEVTEGSPDKVQSAWESMSPVERFDASMGLLGVTSRPGEITPTPGNGTRHSYESQDGFAEGEHAAIEAGLAAGMSRSEIVQALLPVVLETLPDWKAIPWIEAHGDDLDFDEVALAKVKTLGKPVSTWNTNDTPEMRTIDWASRLSDPQQRLSLCRAAFYRMHIRSRGQVETYLQRPNLPEDLRQEFQQIQRGE